MRPIPASRSERMHRFVSPAVLKLMTTAITSSCGSGSRGVSRSTRLIIHELPWEWQQLCRRGHRRGGGEPSDEDDYDVVGAACTARRLPRGNSCRQGTAKTPTTLVPMAPDTPLTIAV